MVVDFLPGFDPHPDAEKFKHLVAHGAFSEEDVKKFFAEGDIELKKYGFAFEMTFRGMQSNCFCAVGQRN